MANEPQPGAAIAPSPILKSAEAEHREEWFLTTADPWNEIVSLQPGGDRTFATTVERMVVNAERAQRPGLEKLLLTALAHVDLTPAGRLFICRMLALVGSAASIPSLALLLNDNATADLARLALDASDDPTINEFYRHALPGLKGAPKAGLIGSIALRGDREAVELLTKIALDPAESSDVRTMAERAVERLSANT